MQEPTQKLLVLLFLVDVMRIYHYTMDFSIFNKTDLATRFKIAQIEKSRINFDDNIVLIRGYLGGAESDESILIVYVILFF